MFHRILLAIDESEYSARATALASAMAKASGACIRLVHHIDLLKFPDHELYGRPVVDAARQAAKDLLASENDRLASSGVESDTRLCEAVGQSLGTCMAEEAQAWNADLVVIGSHGRGALAHILFGSGAEQVVKQSAVPVLVVHGSPVVPPFRRILVAVDGSESATPALRLAVQLAVESDGAVRIFHWPGTSGHPDAARRAVAFAQAAGVDTDLALDSSGPDLGQAVAAEALAWEADLVAIGACGRRASHAAALGRGALQILRASPVSVLVVAPGQAGSA